MKNSGTEANELTADVLLVAHSDKTDRIHFNRGNALSGVMNDIKPGGQPAGLGKVDALYGVNLDDAGANFFHFSVGEDMSTAIDGPTPALQFTEGKLLDASNRTINVVSVKYTLRGTDNSKTVTGYPYATMDLTGMGGDYTLYVEAKAATGTNFTFQTPFVVKMKSQTIN